MQKMTLASALLATAFVLSGCPGGDPSVNVDGGETCGNGVVDQGEACDPMATGAEACPTTCDDGNACTVDDMSGSADTCDLVCTNTAINTCVDADGCCAPGCNALNDSDCTAECGNGIREPGETCDGNCPANCNDGNACTADVATGSNDTCDLVCSNDPITACEGGDGCCPGGCNSQNDSDCSVSCGNGVVEPGETCDSAITDGEGVCPTNCNDGNACTIDGMTGAVANCSAVCTYTQVTACQGGDGCCPSGCNSQNDNDCSSSCGNGVVEAGENCDGNCPTACNDGNACTNDVLTGSAGQCTATCSFNQISQCTGGDGCCPVGCNSQNDTDCSASCGNGIVEAGETCDSAIGSGEGACPTSCNDGNACTLDSQTGSAATCSADCTHQSITQCQDGDGCCPGACNALNDNDCSASCGNNVVESGETCDGNCPADCNDGNACTVDTRNGTPSSCNVTCTRQTIEQCTGGDGCCPSGCNSLNDSDCSASCGNGVVEAGERCDSGIASGEGACPTSCNDGNACTVDTLTGSAASCSATCSNTTITECRGGDGCCPGNCTSLTDSDCSVTCGNGVVETGEQCDSGISGGGAGACPTSCNDGNACTNDVLTGSASNCSATCSYPVISQCNGGDGCCPSGCNSATDSDCSASCGNNIVEAGETCDGNCPTSCEDGNSCTIDSITGAAATCNVSCSHTSISQCTSGDGCCPTGCDDATDSDCSSTCGNNTVDPGETCDNNCPTSCNDGDACTLDSMTGSAANCNVQCSYQAISSCIDADGCCPTGCDAASDSDCSGAGTVGDACLSGGECSSGACITEVDYDWTGGYCSAGCWINPSNPSDPNNVTCPSGSHCGLMDADGQGVCLNTCATNTDCRTPDYECFDGDGDSVGDCLPVASGPGAVGDPCTSTYSDCGGGQLGQCEAAFEEWGLQNYGGYCTQYCSSAAPCPTGSHCGLVGVPFPDSPDWGYCLADCTSGADCRATGYLCADGDYDGTTSECFPAGTGTAAPGQPCEGVWECAGGVDGICFPPDATFKDGYCSQWCNPDAGVTCPSGTHCTAQAGSNSWGRCLDDCGNNTHCRGAGYACYNADGITGNECWYSGTGTGVVGAACSGIWDCAGGQYAYCNLAWPDGYCLIDCSSAYGTTCPAGSTCADWTPSDTTDAADYCVDDCGTAGECRSAYDCYDGFGNGTSACLPQ